MGWTPSKFAFVCCAAAASAAHAETATKTVVLGPQYEASGFHQFFFGRDYRVAWTTPVTLEVLDLQTEAGGLTPVRRVGGQQTLGLALKSPDGRNWTFRGADKDPSSILPPDLQGTIAQSIVRDQIAAGLPASPVVAAALMEAAGVVHPSVRMVVMPDDPALGEFRQAFAGLGGTFEEFPSVPGDGRPGFGGAVEILGHEKFYERLQQGPDVRPDARAFLNARLLDAVMGDWDRHRRQWRWARLPDRPLWQPFPEDRDQAFSRFEGLFLDLGRNAQPRFVEFGAHYPHVKGLTFNGWEQDRQLLAELDAPVWEEIAKSLQAKLTDAVIDGAVARMPAEYQKIEGARLARDLKSRRDRLVEHARHYYRHVARRADVYATDAAEQVAIEHGADGSVEVRVAAGAEPYFVRRFHPRETEEIRIHLLGGDDRVVTSGKPSITVRVLGDEGHDALDDTKGGGTRFSDTDGKIEKGPGTHVDFRPYEPPPPNPKAPWIPPRDWGRDVLSTPWIGYGPDLGFFAGASVAWQSYGFRKDPFARRQLIRAGWSFGAQTGKFDYLGDFRSENSGRRFGLHAFASGIETLHFYGFGNETPEQGDDEFHRVNQQQYLLTPSLSWPVGKRMRFGVGPLLKYSTTETPPDRFIGVIQPTPYGATDFGQVGLNGGFRLDTRDYAKAASKGATLELAGNIYPAVWSVTDTFGEVHATASTYWTAGGYLQPTLALRVGGKRVFGDYPFQEAAYVGGSLSTDERTTVRGFRSGRYAGDASLFGNAELRLFLARFTLLLPADFGIFGLVDTGRVFLEGEDSDQWHTGYGGGIWLAFLSRAYTFTAAVATSEQRTAFYLRGGFAF